jgi:hypothetical protein
MNNYERIDRPFDEVDTSIVRRNGIVYEARAIISPDPEQYVDNEIAKVQILMPTPGQRAAVDRMLRPMLERDAGLTQ